tara:strand:- start:6571 stop:6831 length:261 start_codon:yes stop_codon:yes gene_type:complete
MLGIIFKGIVVGNLVALNLFAWMVYKTFNGKLDFLKSEMALQLEERLAEEYEYFKEDLKGMQGDLLKSQEKLVPKGGTVKSGLPIF